MGQIVTPTDPEPLLTETELVEIATRVYNPLIPMGMAERADLKQLIRYIKHLRERIAQMHEENLGARETIMVLCKRTETQSLEILNTEIASLHQRDRLVVDDLPTIEHPDRKRFQYVPYASARH